MGNGTENSNLFITKTSSSLLLFMNWKDCFTLMKI